MRQVSLQERVGSAINASDLRGHTLTTLNAFAVGSTRLGELLWRLRYGNDHSPQTRKQATVIIAHALKAPPSGTLILVVDRAIEAWLHDRCPECRGRRYTGTEYGDLRAMREPCPDCHGKGKSTGFFHTTQERMLNRVSCQLCGGRGWRESTVVDATKTQVCRTCNGEGRVSHTPGSIAVALGMDKKTFLRNWAKNYYRSLELLRTWDVTTGVTVRAAMRSLDGAPGLHP